MNYRHAYHAGNFADVFKHALVSTLLGHLLQKDAAFMVLDTHAGPGRYDLSSDEARRTGEWRDGIARLYRNDGALRDGLNQHVLSYASRVTTLGGPNIYPGSPSLIAAALRPQDRLVCTELHPDDAVTLSRLFRRDGKVSVHHMDGYLAIKACLPPKAIRRGLVLIDPPFENTNEFETLCDAIIMARRRFPTGIVAAWYPIKHRAPVRAFHDRLAALGLTNLLACELTLRQPVDPTRLNGCGLIVANPPWKFDAAATEILENLARILASDRPAEADVRWIVEAQP